MQDSPPAPRARLAEFAGWYGTIAILGAYALLSFDVIGKNALFHGLNFSGALGVGWVCWRRRAWQAFWLEVVWAAVALLSLLRAWL